MLRITQLYIYPIKSTAGIALSGSEVDLTGLRHDRQYMLVDPQGHFITGRQYPQLTQVRVALTATGLLLNAPGHGPLDISHDAMAAGTLQVTIWRDTCQAIHVSEVYDRWFSHLLGTPCHLVRMPDQSTRRIDPAYATGEQYVRFADGFPLLVISEESLADLNRRLPSPVTMQRFRPNIVVSGCEAYAEDQWSSFHAGKLEMLGVKNCSRCVFTTVDPVTGLKDSDSEPLKTLSTYRRREGGVYLGQNVIPLSLGYLRVGDTIRLAGDQ